VETTEVRDLAGGLVREERSKLSSYFTPNVTAKEVPGRPDVQCQSPSDITYKGIEDTFEEGYYVLENGTVGEQVTARYADNEEAGTTTVISGFNNVTLPCCDYETVVPYKTIERESNEQGWEVIDWSRYSPSYDPALPTGTTYGVRDHQGNLQSFLDLESNETRLALTRGTAMVDGYENVFELTLDKTWQYGRRIRDGLTLALGLFCVTPGHLALAPEGIEFQVDYSVLIGPVERTETTVPYTSFYQVSSWSHSCPLASTTGDLEIATFPLEGDDPMYYQYPYSQSKFSGCLVDVLMSCEFQFPQDNHTGIENEMPRCVPWEMAVTLLGGIEVDPYMLAAYSGIASRNKDFGRFDVVEHHLNLNSIAATYIATREVVPGTVPHEGVRAKINGGFVFVMLLPLLFIVLLLKFKTDEVPPVPQSVWDLLVLGMEDDLVPKRPNPNAPFPPCPDAVKHGTIADQHKKCGHLRLIGLPLNDSCVPVGGSFVEPLGDSLGPVDGKSPEQELEHSEWPGQPMDQSLTQDSTHSSPADPSGIYEIKNTNQYYGGV